MYQLPTYLIHDGTISCGFPGYIGAGEKIKVGESIF